MVDLRLRNPVDRLCQSLPAAAAETTAICESFGYEAFLIQRGEKIAALPAIEPRKKYELGNRY